ncbi:MAG: HAMP domain-containing protein, partial [Deltaproteobacteria bacterium]|nr:HAMP domain-containing protein [Deltaproteobacteria bacterium]
IISIFSALIIYAMVLYKQNVAKMHLINFAYVPLSLGAAEIQSTQGIFNTLTDSLAENESRQMTLDWLNAARKYRPVTLTKLITIIDETLVNSEYIPPAEADFLKELKKRLKDVKRRYRFNENKFDALFIIIKMGKTEEIKLKLEALKRSERLLNNVLMGIGTDVRKHIITVSSQAVVDGNTTTLLLGIMGLLSLVIAFSITLSTRKLLTPLKKLHIGVSKVATGNFESIDLIKKNNEIGALASNFNHMIQALILRDNQLLSTERLATAGKIAAQVTHEIRNPLSSLGLNAELLLDEMESLNASKEAEQLLKAMQDEIDRLTRITEAYLLFARMPSPQKKENSINQIIEETFEFSASQIADAGSKYTLDLKADNNIVLCDREQIRQVLVNLIQNSLQAMGNDGEIIIQTKIRNDSLEIIFSDNGGGIPTEMIRGIFDPFFTTKSTGTGLGLSMVKQIVTAHNGKIEYLQNITNGATFKITLPIIINMN